MGLHRSTATSAGREPLGKLLPEATCGISPCQLPGDEIRNPLRQQELRCWLPGCRLVVGLSWHRGGWRLRATSVWGAQVGFCCFWHFLPHYVHTSESESGSSCGGNAEQREPRTELRSFEGWQRGAGCAVVGSGRVAELGGVGASGGCGATRELQGAIGKRIMKQISACSQRALLTHQVGIGENREVFGIQQLEMEIAAVLWGGRGSSSSEGRSRRLCGGAGSSSRLMRHKRRARRRAWKGGSACGRQG